MRVPKNEIRNPPTSNMVRVITKLMVKQGVQKTDEYCFIRSKIMFNSLEVILTWHGFEIKLI